MMMNPRVLLWTILLLIGAKATLSTGANTVCDSNKFQCLSGNQCINAEWKCDGEDDCQDASDEGDCRKNKPCHGFLCNDGQCKSIKSQCDGNLDCSNGDDEWNCSPLPTQRSIVSTYKPVLQTSKPSYRQPSRGTTSGLSMPAIPTFFHIFFNGFCIRYVVNKCYR